MSEEDLATEQRHPEDERISVIMSRASRHCRNARKSAQSYKMGVPLLNTYGYNKSPKDTASAAAVSIEGLIQELKAIEAETGIKYPDEMTRLEQFAATARSCAKVVKDSMFW